MEWQATGFLLQHAETTQCSYTNKRATALTTITLVKAAETGENHPDRAKEKQSFLKYFTLLRLLDLSNIVLHRQKPKIFQETCQPLRPDGPILSLGEESATDDNVWSPRERLVPQYSHHETDAMRRSGLVLLDLLTPFNSFQTWKLLAAPGSRNLVPK